jgi:hypothetical protein
MTETTATDYLRLLLYQGTGAETIPVGDYLDRRRHGIIDDTVDPGLVALDITSGGEPSWPAPIVVGDLARVTFQMGAADLRIRDGDLAVVRIAIDDYPVGRFLRFRPDGDTVDISLVNVTDPDIAYRYPVDREGLAVPEVYEHIAELGDARSDEEPVATGLPELHVVAFPRGRLGSDLADVAAGGREFYDELGLDYYLELY